MMDVVEEKNNSKSWFEFILDFNLLEKHLSQDKPDPTPEELIIQFLTNAENSSSGFPVQLNQENNGSNKLLSKKAIALKLLSLKTFAFHNWKLQLLERKIPLPIQQTLMNDLLYFIFYGKAVDHDFENQDLSVYMPHEIFAIALHQCWCLRAIKIGRNSNKTFKPPPVPVPGQQNIFYVPPGICESILQGLDSELNKVVSVLQKLLDYNGDYELPTFHSFGTINENMGEFTPDWDTCKQISIDEMKYQIAFDLGSHYMYSEQYDKAREILTLCQKYSKLSPTTFCHVDDKELQGLVIATSTTLVEDTLTQKFIVALNCNYKKCLSLLMEDNVKKEISYELREHFENDLRVLVRKDKDPDKDLVFKVITCNVVRCVVSGICYRGDYGLILKNRGKFGINYLFSVVLHVIKQCDDSEKNKVKVFFFNLLEYKIKDLAPSLVTCELKSLFISEELDYIKSKSQIPIADLNIQVPSKIFYDNPNLDIGELERALILSYNTKEIYDLLMKLGSMNPRKPLRMINLKWELPIPVQSVVLGLPGGLKQDFTYIMLAKAKELTVLKCFAEAIGLIDYVIADLDHSMYQPSNVSYKLLRLLEWERLLTCILEFHHQWPKNTGVNEICHQCRGCLASLIHAEPVIPRSELIEYCVIMMLNVGEWDYLADIDPRWSFLDMANQIACVSRVIARTPPNMVIGPSMWSERLWGTVLGIFVKTPSHGGQKRTANNTPLPPRDSPQPTLSRSAFVQFISKFRDKTVISLVISCLSRILNILRDEGNQDIHLEYPAMWPQVIRNPSAYASSIVEDHLGTIIDLGLKYYPSCIPWLKCKAELCYIQEQWNSVVKNYLEVWCIATNYFSQITPCQVMDDGTIKKMIKSCCQMSCYTQAAVLCQFLLEPDYMTTFKCLAEKNSNDASEQYYKYIWDVTVLEYLVHLHNKRGEIHKKQDAMKVMGTIELNSNNNEEIQREAVNSRKSAFLRAMTRQYLILE